MSESKAVARPDDSPAALQSLQARREQAQDQRTLLAGLRGAAAEHGDSALAGQADALEQQYVAADRSLLSKDVYRSAAHQPAPAGLGYLRASEHPDKLRALGLPWTDAQIKAYLQPDSSDFRAEIYIPDPSVHGPGAKPVIAFKGSNGPVAALDESAQPYSRESAAQDWTENGRQGIGLESDHYNRSMDLARAFQDGYGNAFELDGHSKGGGQAQAAAAVTGMPVYTYNSATLHPATAQRYVDQNGGSLHDVASLNHGFYVKGEVLHDGLALTQGMGGSHRVMLGSSVRNAAALMELPGARERAAEALQTLWPYDRKMQGDALELVDVLANQSDAQLLKRVPQPADTLVELDAKQRSVSGELVDRPSTPDLARLQRDAGPVLGVLTTTLAGAVAGKRVGEIVATGGRAADAAADATGHAVSQGWSIAGRVTHVGADTGGRLAGASILYGGEAVAGMRAAGGHAESLLARGQAGLSTWTNEANGAVLRAASRLPGLGGLDDVATRNEQRATQYSQQKHAQADASLLDAARDVQGVRASAGRHADTAQARLQAGGEGVERLARRVGAEADTAIAGVGDSVRRNTAAAPIVGAASGAAAAGVVGVAVTYGPPGVAPLGTFNAARTAGLIGSVKSGAPDEALQRHDSEATIQPSLDARTRTLENAAITRMRGLERAPHAMAPASAADTGARAGVLIDDPRHASHRLYAGAERGVEALEAGMERAPSLRSRQLAGTIAADMHAAGATSVDHVLLGGDRATVFGVQGRLDDPSHIRVGVDAAAGMVTPIAHSTQRMDETDQHQAALQRQQTLAADVLSVPQARMQMG